MNIYLILSIIGLFVSLRPFSNYWYIVTHYKRFNSEKELWVFTFLQFIFDISVLICFYFFISNSELKTIFPYFVIVQGSFFSMFTLLIPIIASSSIGLKKIKSKIKSRNRLKIKKPKMVNNIIRILSKYFLPINVDNNDKFLLSVKYVKLFLVYFYFISGIFTASGFANELIINVFSTFKEPNSNIDIFKKVYDNEWELYYNVFIITALPILISYTHSKRD